MLIAVVGEAYFIRVAEEDAEAVYTSALTPFFFDAQYLLATVCVCVWVGEWVGGARVRRSNRGVAHRSHDVHTQHLIAMPLKSLHRLYIYAYMYIHIYDAAPDRHAAEIVTPPGEGVRPQAMRSLGGAGGWRRAHA